MNPATYAYRIVYRISCDLECYDCVGAGVTIAPLAEAFRRGLSLFKFCHSCKGSGLDVELGGSG